MRDENWQRLIDENDIKTVHLKYCRGVDRMDYDLIRSCYHPDAIDDHGDYIGGVDGFIDWAKASLPKFVSTNTYTCNQLVEVQGDVAFAEHYGIAYHRLPGEEGGAERDWIGNIRYVDRFERRNGEWRIAKRRALADAYRIDVIESDLTPDDHKRGRRDKTDASYDR